MDRHNRESCGKEVRMKHNLRKAARDRPCTINLYGVCNHDTSTSVLAHLPGPGVGIKADDRHGAIACSACHDAVDGRTQLGYDKDFTMLMFLEAVIRTQKIWIKEGLM